MNEAGGVDSMWRGRPKKQLAKTVMNELEELGLTWREAQAKAQDTVERWNLVAASCPSRNEEVEWVRDLT